MSLSFGVFGWMRTSVPMIAIPTADDSANADWKGKEQKEKVGFG